MTTTSISLLAEALVEIIIQRSVQTFLLAAEREGIAIDSIPQQYLEAVEVGASTGVAQTMIALKNLGMLKTDPLGA